MRIFFLRFRWAPGLRKGNTALYLREMLLCFAGHGNSQAVRQ